MFDFLSEIYNSLGIDYRKFFKMDALSKAGFLASELLLRDLDKTQPKEDMGIILFNHSSSLETDETYQHTINEKDNYFPSPAVFVYTLPNIVTGEIAIRNKIHGETAFYILHKFNAELITEIVMDTFAGTSLKYLLTGWLEVFYNKIDVCMMRCEANGEGLIAFNSENINKLYY
jgi:hypothetical protein